MTPIEESSYWTTHPTLMARRAEFLGSPVHLLSMNETVTLAAEAMEKKHPLRHTVVNVAKLVTMQTNEELRADVCSSDMINIDGMGVVWGARLLGLHVPERVAGIDLMEALFAICADRHFRPFLLGAEPAVLSSVIERLRREMPGVEVAGSHHGYFKIDEEPDIVAAINASGADCLFVAMPTPRKERFLGRHSRSIEASFIMGVGGSFDVYGGKVRRAPQSVQKMGFEWLYRLMQEPTRLWRRYFTTNYAYAGLLWREWRRMKRKASD